MGVGEQRVGPAVAVAVGPVLAAEARIFISNRASTRRAKAHHSSFALKDSQPSFRTVVSGRPAASGHGKGRAALLDDTPSAL